MEKSDYNDSKEDEFEQYVAENNEEFFETDSTKIWLRDITRYPLLSLEEEKKYGKALKEKEGLEILDNKNQLNLEVLFSNLSRNTHTKEILNILLRLYGELDERSLDEYMQKIVKYKKIFEKNGSPLDSEEIRQDLNIEESNIEIGNDELLDQVKKFSRYMEAKYKMFHSNLRLVVRPARRYAYTANMEFVDLASEGSMGLMKAIEKFDADLGFRFSTYAIFWIRQSISRYVNEHASSFKMRANEYKEIKDFRESVEKLEKEMKTKYTAEELSKLFDMPYQEVVGKLYYSSNPVSLSTTISDEDDMTLEETIPGEAVDFEESLFKEELRELLDSCFSYLKPQEELVMRLYTGLNEENKTYNLYEIAKKLKKTRTAVSAIQNRAIKKMRMLVQRNEKAKQLINYMK